MSDTQRAPALTEAVATRFAGIALRHVGREFPHKLDHMMTDREDCDTPRALRPIFFGSLDWHSCVHGYWMLARLLRRYPQMAPSAEIRALFDRSFTPGRVAGECAYFERPSARGFERPYGWAWLFKLMTELQSFPGVSWAASLTSLAAIIAARFRAFLPLAGYPVRAGQHGNTAFALALASDYAAATADAGLTTLFRATALRWYGQDRDCQAWEPGGDDFLSPALAEAECMRRLLRRDDFLAWFDRFLPGLDAGRPATLFVPATVTDRRDGKLAHLDGCNLSRAWCWRALSSALDDRDPRRSRMTAAAASHLAASLPFVAGDYMGEHWLASFALLALDEGA